MRAVLGVLLGLVARVWLFTLRLTLVVSPELARAADRPWVLAFFHGTQFPLLAWKRRKRTAVLVSLSRDGQMQARALSICGMSIVRGSSSRSGASGLRAIIARMRAHAEDAAFAVDGPRGPYGIAKPGALAAARAVDAVIVPMGAHAERAITLEKAWDRFMLPLPFSRVTVVLGAPMEVEAARADGALSGAIADSNRVAARREPENEPALAQG